MKSTKVGCSSYVTRLKSVDPREQHEAGECVFVQLCTGLDGWFLAAAAQDSPKSSEYLWLCRVFISRCLPQTDFSLFAAVAQRKYFSATEDVLRDSSV